MIYPRIYLEGTDLLKRVGVIYSQTLNDLLMKVDEGLEQYPKGFFHTSTNKEMIPSYYHMMWSRDVGRGIIELARAGLTEPLKDAVELILNRGFDLGDHYGRIIWDFNHPDAVSGSSYEVDGNVNLLMGFWLYWKMSGCGHELADRLMRCADSVFGWMERVGEKCPFGFLMGSQSELSGNPDTPYLIYAVYATYGAASAAQAYEDMAKSVGDGARAERYCAFKLRLHDGLLKKLVSEGPGTRQNTITPKGVWINGLHGLTGMAAETGDFGPRFDMHCWTRQVPYVLDYDHCADSTGTQLDEVNQASYNYLRDGMAEYYYFRRYGFVSCTCGKGMGGRHDDTMAGYAQNLFTQAALMADDVNVYTKCIDGICRLAYDGDIVKPLTLDLNPWIMHECFTYENYEQGLDHTFGRVGIPERFIMHNPGDEGNLVQSAETLKTFALVAGITSAENTLIIRPRLPWECTRAEIVDFPVCAEDGTVQRISYEYKAERWKNAYSISIHGVKAFGKIKVRIGPLPRVLCNERTLQKEWRIECFYQASFAEREISLNGENDISVSLINER